MKSARSLKALLLILFLVGAGAIVASIVSRQSSHQAVQAPLLEPEIEQRTIGFEYLERNEGRIVFRVAAEKSTLTQDGLHSLEGVTLVLHQKDGTVSDRISGQQAFYRAAEKRIDFSRSVLMELLDGTRIRSSQVHADLQKQAIFIPQSFEFERGEVVGRGRTLRYHIEAHDLNLGDIVLEIPSGNLPYKARARTALYKIREGRIEMSGDARIRNGVRDLQADRILLRMTPDHKLERIESVGGARMSARERVFSGRRIVNDIDPESGQLTGLLVLSGRGDGSPAERAIYRESSGSNRHSLQADRIAAEPRGIADPSQGVSLQQLRATGDVLFSSPSLGISESRSDVFLAEFHQASEDVRRIELEGGVRILRDSPDGTSHHLQGRSLKALFSKGRVPESVRVEGDPVLDVTSAGGSRRLQAGRLLEFQFESGIISRSIASGRARLESRQGAESSRLSAPSIETAFKNGLPERVAAGSGVEVEIEGLRTSSRTLELVYSKGVLEKGRQEGDFRLVGTDPDLSVEGDWAIFLPKANTLDVGGQGGPYQLRHGDPDGKASVTTARRFLLDRATGRIEAQGDVASTIDQGEKPLLITAQAVSILRDQGVIVYSGHPRVDAAGLQIGAREIRLLQRERKLIAEKEVLTTFQRGVGEDARSFEVGAEKLVLDLALQKAQFTGRVGLTTQDLALRSPTLDLDLSDSESGAFRELMASGGVDLKHLDRQVDGNRLVYDLATDLVTVTGNPVSVRDPEGQNRVTGPRLIFRIGSDSLRMESHANHEPAQTRR